MGKIKVNHKRVPETFIDDALPKFRAYDSQRMARLREQERRVSVRSIKFLQYVFYGNRIQLFGQFSNYSLTHNFIFRTFIMDSMSFLNYFIFTEF